MELLIGEEGISDSAIVDLSCDWLVIDKICVSWKCMWNLKSQLFFGRDSEEKFSGGRDGSVIARYRKQYSEFSTKSIEIYDYKGILLYVYEIRLEANNLFFYVTNDDKLIVLTSTGYLLTFFAGREISKFKLFDVQNEQITCADIWEEGLVFLIGNDKLYYAPSYEKPQLLRDITTISKLGRADVFKAIPPKEGQLPTVLISNSTEILYVVNEVEIKGVKLNGYINNFSVNSNYTNIAFLCGSGRDMQLIVTEIDPSLIALIKDLDYRDETMVQLSWCGSDFPMLSYEGSVNILLHDGQFIDPAKMIEERENKNTSNSGKSMKKVTFPGLSWTFQSSTYSLVFSSGALYKISIINDSFFDAFRKDENKANSMKLVEAFLKRSSERALTMKREGTLMKAMDACRSTSLETDSPKVQQLLMHSANFARTYLNLWDNCDSFADDIKKIRISNSYAIELNCFIQPNYLYDIVSQRDILYRICNRKRFSLALKIADYLSYDKRFIVTEWCLSMAYENQNDETALKFISSKYQQNSELFEINSIATALSKENRLNLAKSVAELDPAKMNIVPFFISCDMWEEALNAAKNSYDSTLFIDTFNKAIDSKKEYEAVDIVNKDKFMFMNIAKLLPPKDFEAIKVEGYKSPLSDRFNSYKRIISENYQMFSPPSMNYFIERLEESKKKFHKNHEINPEDTRTKNQIIEQMILNIDYKDPSNIHEFVKGFTNNYKKTADKHYIMVASVLARHKLWDKYLILADNSFSKYHYNYIFIAQSHFTSDQTMEFIHSIKDEKKVKQFEAFFNNERYKQYGDLMDNNSRDKINCSYFSSESNPLAQLFKFTRL